MFFLLMIMGSLMICKGAYDCHSAMREYVKERYVSPYDVLSDEKKDFTDVNQFV